jgi:putative transposase
MAFASHIRYGRHCVFKLHVHFCLREKIFEQDATNRPKVIFTKVCTNFESQLVEVNGEADHLHLLVNDPYRAACSGLNVPT